METPKIAPELIISAVCEVLGLSEQILKGRIKLRRFGDARFITIVLLKKRAGLTLEEIGEVLGGRNHTTARYGLHKAQDLLATEQGFRNKMRDVLFRLEDV